MDAYLRDEAWFLLRPHDCAVRAGVAPDAPEMREFSRWAFMRARDLAGIGEFKLAGVALNLSRQSWPRALDTQIFRLLVPITGWSATTWLCSLYVRVHHSVSIARQKQCPIKTNRHSQE